MEEAQPEPSPAAEAAPTPVRRSPLARRRALERVAVASRGGLLARRIAFAVLGLAFLFLLGAGAYAAYRSVPVGRARARVNAAAYGRSEARRLAQETNASLVGIAGEVFSWNEGVATVYEVSALLELREPRRLRVVRVEARSGDDRSFEARRTWVLDEVALLPSEQAIDVARSRLGSNVKTVEQD